MLRRFYPPTYPGALHLRYSENGLLLYMGLYAPPSPPSPFPPHSSTSPSFPSSDQSPQIRDMPLPFSEGPVPANLDSPLPRTPPSNFYEFRRSILRAISNSVFLSPQQPASRQTLRLSYPSSQLPVPPPVLIINFYPSCRCFSFLSPYAIWPLDRSSLHYDD